MLYLQKLLATAVWPFSQTLALGVAAALLLLAGFRRLALVVLVVALGWLWLWSTPVASEWLQLTLEGQHEAQRARDLPQAEVAVVLGGGVAPAGEGFPYPDLQAGADRVWFAAKLYHAGRVERVIAAGGRLPHLGRAGSEAAAMQAFLVDLGVPRAAIVLEAESRTTRENAVNVASHLEAEGIEGVLLVTSALHMPRDLASFRAVGVDPEPAATDFRVQARTQGPFRWLPDLAALEKSSRSFWEYAGLAMYRIRGWAE